MPVLTVKKRFFRLKAVFCYNLSHTIYCNCVKNYHTRYCIFKLDFARCGYYTFFYHAPESGEQKTYAHKILYTICCASDIQYILNTVAAKCGTPKGERYESNKAR